MWLCLSKTGIIKHYLYGRYTNKIKTLLTINLYILFLNVILPTNILPIPYSQVNPPLNGIRFQTADSTVSVSTSIELELKNRKENN